MTYESDTVVRDGMVAVHPDLDGRRVHIIVIPIDDEPREMESEVDALFAASIPGVRITPMSRDEAHARP